MAKGAWHGVTVYGVTKVRHDLVTKPPIIFKHMVTQKIAQILKVGLNLTH